MDMKNEVLNFIKYFKDGKEMFLYGRCYWFDVILKERFGEQYGATIMYDPVMNHWVTSIGDIGLFDASGEIDKEKHKKDFERFVIWDTYMLEDKLHTERLIAQCINYTE